MRNNDINNQPIALFIFAFLFIVFGGVCVGISLKGEETNVLLILMAGVLFVIGLIMLIYAIMRAKAFKQVKTLNADPNAHETMATFVRAKMSSYNKSSVSVGRLDVPTSINVFKKIIYTYTDENGVTRKAKSVNSFFPAQAQYLQDKGTFKIKCKGKVSVITEPVPESNTRYNL